MSPKPDTCPLCDRPAATAHAPFCSQGCKDRDLLNWLGEAYRAPALPDEDDLASTGLDNSANA